MRFGENKTARLAGVKSRLDSWILIFSLGLIMTAMIGCSVIPSPTWTPVPTFTPVPTWTPEPTWTAVPIPTDTPIPVPRDMPIPTPSAMNAEDVIRVSLGSIAYKWLVLDEGQLVFKDDGFIETIKLIDDIRNFAASVEFEVPYSPQTGEWDFGFIFRYESGKDFDLVRAQSNGVYTHSTVRKGVWNTVNRGIARELETFTGANNTLRLDVIENRGWFSVNDILIADFDLNGSSQSGELSLASSVTGSGIPDRHIKFSNVGVLEIFQMSQTKSGNLTTNSDHVGVTEANVDALFGYAEATIELSANVVNWSMGVGFRQNDLESDYLVFHINDHSQWSVEHATDSGDSWQELGGGRSNAISVTRPISNHLEVFFSGNHAYVYVNGRSFLGYAYIGSVIGTGDVSVLFGIFQDDDSATVRFKDFNVWGVGF